MLHFRICLKHAFQNFNILALLIKPMTLNFLNIDFSYLSFVIE